MDAAGYTTLTRQSGLMREMQVVANNIANVSTAGFRREGLMFEEFIAPAGGGPSLSMALGNVRRIDLSQGALSKTGGTYDLAIQGEGFFKLQTAGGERLTRFGGFGLNAEGEMVTPDGNVLLDEGGSPLSIPQGTKTISIGLDGTISGDGNAIGKIGLWLPEDPTDLRHEAGTLFSTGSSVPFAGAQVSQGFLEDSNVEPVNEIARMITVQRSYELGQSFLEMEDKRIRGVLERLGR